jgi:hypothetical protein
VGGFVRREGSVVGCSTRLERWVLDEKKKEHGKTDTKNDLN